MNEDNYDEWYHLCEKEYKPMIITVNAEQVAKELADNHVYNLSDTREYTEEHKKTLAAMWKLKYDYFLDILKKNAHIK
jgi:hypothetical protein